MIKKASKQEVITSIAIFIWIFLLNIVTPMITTLPSWPMWFVTIFFFIMGGDTKNLKTIFAGALVGLCAAFTLTKLLGVMAPKLGEMPSVAILLFVILGIIIVGGNFVPLLFNNVAFAYLTIATLNLGVVEEHFVGWIIMLLVGGGLIVVGAILCMTLTNKLFANKQTE